MAGPYEIAISCLVLFAVDFLAERQSFSRPRRAMLTVASAVALWSVSVRWGHPEDAVAVGLLLYGIGVLPSPRRAAWLIGAAVVVQPLVLLSLPVVLARLDELRRLPGFLVRAAVPSAVCFLPASAGDAPTRAAAGMREAARLYPHGAVVVVGCAPTALVEAIGLDWEPAVVIGLPFGFVGAAESKALARASRHRTITNVGEKGGSAVAAAATNALRRLADAR